MLRISPGPADLCEVWGDTSWYFVFYGSYCFDLHGRVADNHFVFYSPSKPFLLYFLSNTKAHFFLAKMYLKCVVSYAYFSLKNLVWIKPLKFHAQKFIKEIVIFVYSLVAVSYVLTNLPLCFMWPIYKVFVLFFS